MMRTVFTVIGSVGAVAIVLFVIACAGFMFPIESAFYLVFGWAFYLGRVLPRVRPDWSVVATAAICLAGFAWGSHRLLTWLCEQPGEGAGLDETAALKRWRAQWTGAIVAVVVVMFAAGVAAVGVTHQVGWLMTSKDPLVEDRGNTGDESMYHLELMARGVSDYRHAHAVLPAGGTFDASGRPLHGWQTMILPFLHEAELFDRIDLTVPWDDIRNREPFRTEVWIYLNRSVRRAGPIGKDGYVPSHYSGNVRVLGARRLERIKDGASQTILAGEAAGDFHAWGDPVNWRDPALGINRTPAGFGGPLSGGAFFTFADGSARFLKDTTDLNVLKALSTPDGGEEVSKDSY